MGIEYLIGIYIDDNCVGTLKPKSRREYDTMLITFRMSGHTTVDSKAYGDLVLGTVRIYV